MATAMVFENNDERLRADAARVVEDRHAAGLNGLTRDLESVVINTEPDRLDSAAQHLVNTTGYAFDEAFEADGVRSCVLTCPQSAALILQCRPAGTPNPFLPFNRHPKSAHLPDTRMETLVFACTDVERVVRLQQRRGVRFLTPAPVDTSTYRFIQTAPSVRTGNSIGLIEWKHEAGRYGHDRCRPVELALTKPPRPYLHRIGTLDHMATRVHAEDRDPAILEFLQLTDYTFDFDIYVEELNSITNVARLPGARFALVFTSGIHATETNFDPGPTEQFVRNYGARAHHMAFLTRNLAETDPALRADGLPFLSELVGSESDGIRQSFSEPSADTLLVNEYIERYGDFDGFFTPSNVSRLTQATAGQ